MIEDSGPTAPPLDPWVETLRIVLRRGLDLRERGDLTGALECFDRCADLAREVSCIPLQASAAACKGTISMIQGSVEQARSHFEAALEIRRSLGDLIGEARSLNDLAQCDMRAGRADQALTRLRESLARTSGVEPGRARAETLEQLGRVHRDRGDFPESLRFLKDALEIRRELSDEAGIAQDLDAVGMVYYRMGSPEEAFEHLQRAYAARRALPDRRAVAVTAHNLGLVHYGQGQLQEAEALLGEALTTFRAVGDLVQMAHAHSNLGLVLAAQGHMNEAMEHHRESLNIRERLNDVPGQAISLNNLSHLASETGRPGDGLTLAERSIELRRASGLAHAVAKPLYNRGRCLLDLGRYEEALEAASEIEALARENRAIESEAEGLLLRAEALLAIRRAKEATEAASAAWPLADRIGDPSLIASALRIQGSIRAVEGDADAARDLLVRAERALRGRAHPMERARIDREQAALAAAAGAEQSAANQLQRAIRDFHRIGNRGEEARTLALLASVQFSSSPVQARKTWTEAEEAALEARGRGQFVDLGVPPGAEPTATAPNSSMAETLIELFGSLADAASIEDLVLSLARIERIAQAGGVGLAIDGSPPGGGGSRRKRTIHASTDSARRRLEELDAAPEADRKGHLILEAIPGTDDSCHLIAADLPQDGIGRGLIALAAQWIGRCRISGIDAVGSEPAARTQDRWEGLVGSTPRMRELYGKIERVAQSDVSVLILGESGTGKELVARAVHSRSRRAQGPFVPINCPSIPRELIEAELFGHERGAYTGATTSRPGRVELADRGTLFLDEVGDMDLATQSKLLRFLQEREFQRVGGRQTLKVDVRVLAATSRNLQEAIEAGAFRADLFFRLNVVQLAIPPLRERRDDIPALVHAFLSEIGQAAGRELSITTKAIEVLQRHAWPGNVRELRNTIAHMAAMADSTTLEAGGIPASIPAGTGRAIEPGHRCATDADGSRQTDSLRPGETLRDRLVEVEARLIRQALDAEAWNQSAAARRLGVTETMIRNRMKQLGVQRPEADSDSGGGKQR